MSCLALYVFGPPKIALDEASIHIPRRKAIATLVYLAVTGQTQSRDSLAALLWPENNQGKARAELRRMLSALNQVLGSNWLYADRETVCLNTNNDPSEGGTFWLDVAEFQGKLKFCESLNHPPTLTCPDCLPALEEAVVLYNDDFMAGFSLKDCPAYDEWQFFQREDLRTQLAGVLIRLSSHYANVNEYETAIHFTRRWLALDPLHEPAHRQLMGVYDQAGQRAAALRQYEICCEILSSEIGVEPSEDIKELYQRIQARTLVSATPLRPKSKLPVQTTPFIGRETELAEIQVKLKDDNCRLLTLLGPGGSGKTRLSIQAAGQLVDDFKHGVFFVNLAPVQSADLILSTLASALRFSYYEEGTPDEQLLDYLKNKEMLLILDNFEHLLAGVSFVNQILNTTFGIKILATSRARLMVTGEHLYDVWGMAYPDAAVPAKIAPQRYSALKLFESEASRVLSDFKLNEENLPDVIRICGLLEGMPLGIVLAANWVRSLPLGEITSEIARDLAFLETELQDLPQRQRSLLSVFNHSWRLLSDSEREIMMALSVFRGSFTRMSAQEIAGASLGVLMRLIDKSILHRTPDGRYEIHELLRQYAAEKLALDLKVEAKIRGEHSDFYCRAMASWERDLQGPRQGDARKEMVVEIDNIRAAWAWSVENARIKALLGGLNGLCIFYNVRRQRLEGAAVCQTLLDQLTEVRGLDPNETGELSKQNEILKLKARTLAWGCYFNGILGNLDLAHTLGQKCLSLLGTSQLTSQDILFEKGVVIFSMSWIKRHRSHVESIQLAKQAVDLFDALNEDWWKGWGLQNLGLQTEAISRYESIKIIEESLAVRRRLGDLKGVAELLRVLSWYSAIQFQFKIAEEILQEALAIGKELEDHHNIVSNYGALGIQWVWQGRFHEARTLIQETLVAYHDLVYNQSNAALIHVRAGFPDLYLGEYGAARNQMRYAHKLIKNAKSAWVVNWNAIAGEILGSISLAEESYIEADKWFRECLRIIAVPDKIAKVLACQGFVSRGLKRTSQARGKLYKSLKVVVEEQQYFPLTHTLPGIALLFADQGEVERAVELYALASTYGIVSNSKWFADIAGDEIASAAEGLPDEVAETAKARGRELDLWEMAEELLVELDERGWGESEPPDSTE